MSDDTPTTSAKTADELQKANVIIAESEGKVSQETGSKVAAYEIEIEGYKCRLTKMNRATMEVALGLIMPGGGNPPKYIKAGEIILNTCWLDGDKKILEDEELLVAAAMAAYELVDLKVAKLKKL